MASRRSNEMASETWNRRAVGSQRSSAPEGSRIFFEEVRRYRYGYETPWIPEIFRFGALRGERVLEIGVGLGIDAAEMVENGAIYTGVDITPRHVELARTNLTQRFSTLPDFEDRVRFIQADLLDIKFESSFDRVYSFGTLHHIQHELDYLEKIHALLSDGGTLSIGLYASFSFFNAYMLSTWLVRNRMKDTLNAWSSHVAEGSFLESPVVIKIRNRAEIEKLLHQAGFEVVRYTKRGFVQNYLPVIGKHLDPNGRILNGLGRLLGWYHCFECKKVVGMQ